MKHMILENLAQFLKRVFGDNIINNFINMNMQNDEQTNLAKYI